LVGENGGPIADSYAQGTVTDKYGGKIGGLVGENTASGTTTNCHAEVEVTVTSGNTSYGSAGGLVGYNYGDITESYAVGEVLGRYHVGGLVGTSTGTIDKSYATATVTGTHSNDTRVGGLVGNNDGSISNSFTRGAVSGEERVGGLVGYNKSSITSSYEKSSITTSYATGEVNGGSSYIGGLAGYNYSKGDLGWYHYGQLLGYPDITSGIFRRRCRKKHCRNEAAGDLCELGFLPTYGVLMIAIMTDTHS